MKILAVCETLDFQNYTRRATFEAIARATNALDVICHGPITGVLRAQCASRYAPVRTCYRWLPLRWTWRPTIAGRWLATSRSRSWKRIFRDYDVVVFTSPYQAPLVEACTSHTVFVLSDAYHLFGSTSFDDEKRLLSQAHLVLATSSQLAETYVPRYFNMGIDRVRYWPNTVDLESWNIERFPGHGQKRGKAVLGFAGNFMRITDLELLDVLTDRIQDCAFQLAGAVTYKDPTFQARFRQITAKKHVSYLGLISYEQLPGVIAGWDVCLMLDDVSEFSSYHHHNKVYQYLAMGKPVVAQRNHNDYDHMNNVVFLSGTHEGFIENVGLARGVCTRASVRAACLEHAKANSSDVRASQFLRELEGSGLSL